MADLVKIQRTFDNGETLTSEVQIESLSVWIDHGWDVVPNFLADEEPVQEFTYEDWVAAGGETVIEDAEPVADETADGDLSQDITDEEI